MQSLALASVVTFPLFNEFCVLKYSFELFHGDDFVWHVRCDRETETRLIHCHNVKCTVFAETVKRRTVGDDGFQEIVAQKMIALDDAWRDTDTTQVLFMDADLVITATLLEELTSLQADLVLTPNHLPHKEQQLAPFHGYFNSGFILTRNPDFHRQWRDAFTSQPWLYSDQVCLNEVVRQFKVKLLSSSANIGFWHSKGGWCFDLIACPRIASLCMYIYLTLLKHIEAGLTVRLHCTF